MGSSRVVAAAKRVDKSVDSALVCQSLPSHLQHISHQGRLQTEGMHTKILHVTIGRADRGC